jgi:cupin superfamily acireductone dioxygenase involved in methionine salvage
MNNFPTENLKSIRIISAALSHPIAIACYSQEDEELVAGLESIIKQNGYTCADVVSWCKDKELLFSAYRMPGNGSRKFQ